MMQISWRKLTHELRVTYIAIFHFCGHISYQSYLPASALTCGVPDTFLLVFQMFNRGKHKHNEVPDKVLTVCFMCIKSHNCSYVLKKPFPAHGPRFLHSSWFTWKVCTLDRLMVGWDFPPMLIALCGSVPITSFCLPHSAFGGECRRPRCEEWTQKSVSAVSNEASYQTDETVMDGMSLPHSPLYSDYYLH